MEALSLERSSETAAVPRAGRPDASAEIWDWRGRGETPPDPGAARRRARLRGTLQALVGASVATALLFFGHRLVGGVVATLAACIALTAWLSPDGLFAAIERAFAALGHWVGRALTWTLMPLLFFAFFLPFSVLFRRGRRDSMRRFFEPEAETYWSDRQRGRAGSESRSRQY